MSAVPAKHFAKGPYRAEQVGSTWWGVMNVNGFNCLTFTDKPGAVVTNEPHAKEIADMFNNTPSFEYLADSYVAPVTQRWTDQQMADYVRSQVYDPVTKSWGVPVANTGVQA